LTVPIALLEAVADAAGPVQPQPILPNSLELAVRQVVPHLEAAQRPLFILGGGARFADARALLEQLGAACFTTYAGRGAAGESYPLDFGAALAKPGSVDVIASADLVIALGTELAEVDLWRARLGNSATLIRVDIDPTCLTDAQSADIMVLGDAAEFVQSLRTATSGLPAATGWSHPEVSTARARWRAETDAARPGIVPVCDALRAAVPDDTMIYSDMTQLAYVAKEVWEMRRPNHWHHPYGFGTLGYATPAAIGGAVARRGKPTMALIGDYGFHYTMQELGVAVELGLSLPIILWDNGKLGEIEDSMVRAQIAPNAVVARNPDFCKLAEAFGARAEAPSTLAELQSVVHAAFSAGGPTLIHLTPAVSR
jgi:acetolactate synthase-1/2/3 large subunit/5-guanidino-2-oxopentanoate decarboxylase